MYMSWHQKTTYIRGCIIKNLVQLIRRSLGIHHASIVEVHLDMYESPVSCTGLLVSASTRENVLGLDPGICLPCGTNTF
jgi:hypothetical protein